MIKSQYILDILDLAFDDHSASDLLRKQVLFISVTNTEHTGSGAFIHFQPDHQIQQFKLDTTNATNFDIEGNAIVMIFRIEIRNTELSILADAIVHLKNGVIDHLEIWNKCGEEYVQTEPEHYELYQTWLGNNNPRIIIR
jgi:hypothetical protein